MVVAAAGVASLQMAPLHWSLPAAGVVRATCKTASAVLNNFHKAGEFKVGLTGMAAMAVLAAVAVAVAVVQSAVPLAAVEVEA
jgi:hypothetical protein